MTTTPKHPEAKAACVQGRSIFSHPSEEVSTYVDCNILDRKSPRGLRRAPSGALNPDTPDDRNAFSEEVYLCKTDGRI